MKKKRMLLIILFVICFSLGAINANAEENIQPIAYKKLFDISLKEGYESFQGMTITDKYIVIAMIKNDSTKSALLVYDKYSYTLADLGSIQNPIENYNIGHANDMAFNEAKKEIYIIMENKIIVIDSENFQQKDTISLEKSYGGITLGQNGEYLFQKDNKIYVMNDNLEVKKEIDSFSNLTHQNIAYYKGSIFHTCYEYGKVGPYQPVYDGIYEANSNLIYVYDESGNKKNTFFIPVGYGEIEALEFDKNGMPYVLFNSPNAKGSIYVPIYEDATVKISVTDQNLRDESRAALRDENGDIETVAIKDGAYTFQNLVYYEQGTHKYSISKIKEENALERLQEESINVTVNVVYDASVNQLKAIPEYEKEGFKEENDNNQDVIDTPINPGQSSNEVVDSETVENPQTGSFLPISVIVGVIISALGILIYKKKLFFRL